MTGEGCATRAQSSCPREDAYREYEYCRHGIEKYDEHLFRIRQWNIGLTAVALAAIMGLSQTNTFKTGETSVIGSFDPVVTLFVYTSIGMIFWFLDAFNKSLQVVHIHNCRDIERFLRDKSGKSQYVGPSIALRFRRKEGRHWVSTIKNLTDESVMRFHIWSIIVFWAAISIKFKLFSAITMAINSGSVWSYFGFRHLPLLIIVLLVFLIFLSYLWSRGHNIPVWICPISKFFLRPKAAALARCRRDMKELIEIAGHSEKFDFWAPPFRADFYYEGNVKRAVFVDRYKVSRDEIYIKDRKDLFKKYFCIEVQTVAWRRNRYFGYWRPDAELQKIC